MRVASGHLSYCTNIHPGESWPEVASQLSGPIAQVRGKFSDQAAFCVGLRLSAKAAQQLQAPEALKALQHTLTSFGGYVVSLNGFPYGTFHQAPVKAGVYHPDWRTPERGDYTKQLAQVLAALLPAGESGSISTVPGAFKAACSTAGDAALIAHNLVAIAKYLFELRREQGCHITLALEPEPLCLLETVEETLSFFTHQLWTPENCRFLAQSLGLPNSKAAEAVLREHIGVCLDACHSAVEFEEPLSVVNRFEQAGVQIAKLQISAALRLDPRNATQLAALRSYKEDVYLHQVIARPGAELLASTGLLRFADLEEALGNPNALASEEWRVHYHVPIYQAELESLSSTQPQLGALLARQRERPFTQHLEVETYTWDVLPEAQRGISLIDSITQELQWAAAQL